MSATSSTRRGRAEPRAAESATPARALGGTYNPESDAVRIGVGRYFVAVRASEHRHIVVDPRAAPDDSHRSGMRAPRILYVAGGIRVRVIPVGHPLPHVARDVVQTVGVRRVGAGWTRASLALG